VWFGSWGQMCLVYRMVERGGGWGGVPASGSYWFPGFRSLMFLCLFVMGTFFFFCVTGSFWVH